VVVALHTQMVVAGTVVVGRAVAAQVEGRVLLVQQTQVVAAVLAGLDTAEEMVDQALSLSVTPTPTQPQQAPLVRQPLPILAETVSTNGLDQGASHSDGTFCSTR
jgi:hypothetical protein